VTAIAGCTDRYISRPHAVDSVGWERPCRAQTADV
jgi:hypothetical protein